MKTKAPKLSVVFLLASYLTLIAILITTVLMLPSWFEKVELSYITEAEQNIHTIIADKAENELMAELKTLRNEYPMEIAVYKNGKSIYNTLPGITFQDLREVLQQSAVVYEAQGTLDGVAATYDVWYSIYRPSIQIYFNNIVMLQFAVIILTSVLIVTISFILHRTLMKPLTQVKASLEKLEAYELEDIQTDTDDVINESLKRFAGSLHNKIRAVSRNHTELEHALQLERERLQNMITVSRGIIHDLKSPLHQTLVENDFFIRQLEDSDSKTREIAEYNMEQMADTIGQINEVLGLLDADVKEMTKVKDTFDVVKMFKEIRKGFYRFIEDKKLYLNAEMPEQLTVAINKVALRLILHNLFSNVTQYAEPNTDVDFELYAENGELNIHCQNVSSEANIERIYHSEELFTAIPDSDAAADSPYIYSTGNGLYLIKELTLLSKGTYDLRVNESDVIINITLPLGKGGDTDA